MKHLSEGNGIGHRGWFAACRFVPYLETLTKAILFSFAFFSCKRRRLQMDKHMVHTLEGTVIEATIVIAATVQLPPLRERYTLMRDTTATARRQSLVAPTKNCLALRSEQT